MMVLVIMFIQFRERQSTGNHWGSVPAGKLVLNIELRARPISLQTYRWAPGGGLSAKINQPDTGAICGRKY